MTAAPDVLPEPLVPADVDLSGMSYMPLEISRLLNSDLFVLSTGDEFKAALSLWCKSWQQVPAGSLPNNDRILAHLSGTFQKWGKVKAVALQGWTLCSDGRFYHHVVAEKALAAWEQRKEYEERRLNEAERQRRHRDDHKALREQLRDMGIVVSHTQEISEMDHDISDVVTALKAHKDTIEGQGQKQSELSARILELEQEAVNSRKRTRSTNATDGDDSNVISAAVVEADGLASIRAGQKSTGKMRVDTGLRAAVTNPNKGTTGSTSYPTAPARAPGIQGIPQPRLSLLDVLPIVPVDGSTYEYVQLDGYLSGAAYQTKEGDEKAEGQLPTKLSRAEIATIATWIPASLQVLNDNSQLQEQVGLLMSVGVRQKLETELLIGDGGPGEILGFIAQATTVTPGLTGRPVDRIGLALTDLKAAGWNPNVIVMNPRDWFAIESERAESGDGQYVIGTPRNPAPPSLWGTPVVVTMGMPELGALILDTSTTALLDRQEVTVEASRMDGDNFRRNLVTILAELRAGLAVYAPTSMRLVPLTTTTAP